MSSLAESLVNAFDARDIRRIVIALVESERPAAAQELLAAIIASKRPRTSAPLTVKEENSENLRERMNALKRAIKAPNSREHLAEKLGVGRSTLQLYINQPHRAPDSFLEDLRKLEKEVSA